VIANPCHSMFTISLLTKQPHDREEIASLLDRGEDSIAERVFQAWSPRVIKLLEGTHDAGGHLVDACRVGTVQWIVRHCAVATAGVEVDHIVSSGSGNQPEQ